MTHLTQSADSLWAGVVTELGEEGYTFDRLNESRTEFLARALGDPDAFLVKSFGELLAELNSHFGGAVISNLLMNYGELMWTLTDSLDESGGGGEEYQAQAVTLSDIRIEAEGESAHMATPPADSPYGFLSVFLKKQNQQISVFNNTMSAVTINSDGEINIDLADGDFTNYVSLRATGAFPDDEWAHLLLAWDTDHNVGDRVAALYVNDVYVSSLAPIDEDGVAFDVVFAGLNTKFLGLNTGITFSASEYGLWVGQSIIEANGTISEANRRKFIDANGRPADPSGWPANPVVRLSGEASAFAVNQGTGGAVTTNLGGTLTDADASEPVELPGVPEWVPESATFFADFENGHYWDGTAEVSFSSMVSNPAEDYSIEGGLLVLGDDLRFVGNSRDAFIAPLGCTIVIEGEFIANWENLITINDEFSHAIDSYIDGSGSSGFYIEINGTDEYHFIESGQVYAGLAPMKVAMTLTPDKMVLSDRGGAIVSQALTPAIHWWVWDTADIRGIGQKHKTITVYPPKDDADLPTLSAL